MPVDTYMEAHHLIHMAFQYHFDNINLDAEDNIFSLCSHCHREIHFGEIKRKVEMTQQLYSQREKSFQDIGLSYQSVIDLIFGKNM